MSKYDIFVPSGEKRPCIRIMDRNHDTYFCGYDFMGSVAWSNDIDQATRFNSLEEARQIVTDLEAADAVTVPAPVPVIHGDKISALGQSFTVDRILYQDYFGPRSAVAPGSDMWGYDIEFIDTRGAYHHWKQNQDHGQAARWDGRAWRPYNVDGDPVRKEA